MTNDHHTIPLIVQRSPTLVRNRLFLQGPSTLEGEEWEDEDLLIDLDERRRLPVRDFRTVRVRGSGLVQRNYEVVKPSGGGG